MRIKVSEGFGIKARNKVWNKAANKNQGFKDSESRFLRFFAGYTCILMRCKVVLRLAVKGTYCAGWSSLVARRAHNPEVIGSNPVPATNKIAVQPLNRLNCFLLLAAILGVNGV